MKESELVASCLEYLSYKDNVLAWRNNAGSMPVVNKYGKKHYMRLAPAGSPDIIAVRDGQIIGLECKIHPNKQSDTQKKFQEALENVGGRYHMIYDLGDLMKIL